jgi:glycerol-3-phosphate dehydrogenase
VLALATERGELAQPVVAGIPDVLAEVALAARHEQARSIGDVLLRRTRLGLLAARELIASSPASEPGPVQRVGDVLARELGWDEARLAQELESFAEEARAEGIAAVAAGTAGTPRSSSEPSPDA